MIFRGLLGCAAMIVFIASASTADAAGDRRVALVIGNNDYQYAKKLDNAVADAQAFRRELETRGFQVVYRENANRRAMNGAMEVRRQAEHGCDRSDLLLGAWRPDQRCELSYSDGSFGQGGIGFCLRCGGSDQTSGSCFPDAGEVCAGGD